MAILFFKDDIFVGLFFFFWQWHETPKEEMIISTYSA